MKVTTTWLKNCLGRTILYEYSDQQIVTALERSGLEIEQVSYSKPISPLVITCSVKNVVQHPSADKLKIVELSTGASVVSVVCGAPNVREGMVAALAQVGSILPSGDKIGAAKLRGVESHGMLCSPYELGLSDDHDGILELDPTLAPGKPLAEIYPADTVIDLKTPANRSDVLSICGIARDVAAILGESVDLTSKLLVDFEPDTKIVAQTDGGKPLLLVHVSLDSGAQTPDWMVSRLQAIGQRSKGLLVDVTNYVMFETGQPLHAYDAHRVKWPLSVRTAKAGEKLITLDGITRTLTPDDLVISDSDGPTGLAGIMGGEASQVSENTTEIWLEAGIFDAVKVRKTAQRLGLRTEASARFERRLPTQLPQQGLERALELLKQLGDAKVGEAVWGGTQEFPPAQQVSVDIDWIRKMTGVPLKSDETLELLHNLGFLGRSHDNFLEVEVPWWRPDVVCREDVLEEVVRLIGYDKVPATIPAWRPQTVSFDYRRRLMETVRQTLSSVGLFEVMTYSFVAGEQVERLETTDSHLELQNPMSVEQAFLRTTMLASHLKVAEKNRAYAKALSFYEISKVFREKESGELPFEPLLLAVTVVRPTQSYLVAKGILDALCRRLGVSAEVTQAKIPNLIAGRSGEISIDGDVIGTIGQVRTSLVHFHKIDREYTYFELDLQRLLSHSQPVKYREPARFPVITRDVSLWVPQTSSWQEIAQLVAQWQPEYVGEYRSEDTPVGQKGLTLRLTFGHDDRTPTEIEATESLAKAISVLVRKIGATLRD